MPSNKKHLTMLGVSHKTAPVELREMIALNTEESKTFLGKIIVYDSISECVVLSTCNRTEFYAYTHDGNIEEIILKHVHELKPQHSQTFSLHFEMLKNEEAAKHLLRVSAGLESLLLGEPQILGQIKEQYLDAANSKTTDFFLNKLFNIAVKTGKRTRSETKLGEGAGSIALATVELSEKIFSDLSNLEVLVLGAGDTAELTSMHLLKKGCNKISIINRTFENAQALAKKIDGKAFSWGDLPKLLKKVDLVIGSTASPNFVITHAMIEEILKERKNTSLFLIDIAVPRDFDPKINDLENVFLHGIDELNKIVDANLSLRKQQIPSVEKIIEEELSVFKNFWNYQNIQPIIGELKQKWNQLAQNQLVKHEKDLKNTDVEVVEKVINATINKILQDPVKMMKNYSNGYLEGESKIALIKELFSLGNENE